MVNTCSIYQTAWWWWQYSLQLVSSSSLHHHHHYLILAVLVSSYSYCTPKLSPLLARHQHQWAKAYLGGTNFLIPVGRPLHGACTIQALLSPPPVLRYAYCTLFPSVKRLPAPLRASQPAWERARDLVLGGRERERHRAESYTHTPHHTHATPLHQHPLLAPSTRPLLHACCPPATGIALSLHHAQSSRLPRPHETRPCCPTPHSTAPITGTCRRPHCPLRYSNARFSPRYRACRLWEENRRTAHWRC